MAADFRLDELDAHEQPSDEMRAEWKAFSRMEPRDLIKDARIDDPRLPLAETEFRTSGSVPRSSIAEAFSHLSPELASEAQGDAPILYHPLLPGLLILPSLVPAPVQLSLMDRMLHRDLSRPHHQTNMHLHYHLPYPEGSTDAERSFFSLPPDAPPNFIPKDPAVHKPLSARQVMQRRLHWVTLGGQYDWTNRVYPGEEPPVFPPDIAGFLQTLFPETLAQAAIVNFYSPGDTMMMHRDVSEEVNKGLVSLSFGCDGLFMIAPSPGVDDAPLEVKKEQQQQQQQQQSEVAEEKKEGKKPYILLRLRSGDAIYMTGESRYAWHGVPKVLKDTCPAYLQDWPAGDGRFDEWQGWMKSKRINLNVRQMRD